MKILRVKTRHLRYTSLHVRQWNPESSEKLFFWNWKSRSWESWTRESGIQLKKFGIPLTIEIRNPSSTNKESEIYCLESGIHSMESRIQDCLAFPYIMWHTNHNKLYWQQRANNKIDHGKFTVPNTCTRILQVKTRHLRYTNELLCRQQRTNSLFMGISDEIEVATVAILTKRRYWRLRRRPFCHFDNVWSDYMSLAIAKKKSTKQGAAPSEFRYSFPKTMKRRPLWSTKQILWELNLFLMKKNSFVQIKLCERKTLSLFRQNR